jgi:hypothetical protein
MAFSAALYRSSTSCGLVDEVLVEEIRKLAKSHSKDIVSRRSYCGVEGDAFGEVLLQNVRKRARINGVGASWMATCIMAYIRASCSGSLPGDGRDQRHRPRWRSTRGLIAAGTCDGNAARPALVAGCCPTTMVQKATTELRLYVSSRFLPDPGRARWLSYWGNGAARPRREAYRVLTPTGAPSRARGEDASRS